MKGKGKGKGRGIVTASYVGYAPRLSPVPEDPDVRSRHQAIHQGCQDLQKEMDAMRRKMEILIQRKRTLLAEVQFLRRQHRYFIDNQISRPPQSRHNTKAKTSGTKSKAVKRKDPATKASPQGIPVSGSNSKKQKTNTVKCTALPPVYPKQGRKISQKDNPVLHGSSMSLDLNQRDLLVAGREVPSLNTQSTYELQQKQMVHQEVEATVQQRPPGFDLNEVSAEELQTGNEPPSTEVAHKFPRYSGVEERGNEIDIAGYRSRTSVKGPNKAGKRRISWQDQVAVRV